MIVGNRLFVDRLNARFKYSIRLLIVEIVNEVLIRGCEDDLEARVMKETRYKSPAYMMRLSERDWQ